MRKTGVANATIALFLALSLAGCGADEAGPDAPKGKPLVVFLVRHAEKDKGGDPPLTKAGAARAQTLAQMLRSADIAYVHSTDTKRTKATAAPTADRLKKTVRLYGDNKDVLAKLRKAGGRHLVVGHSNTVPALVGLLGGAPGGTIQEAEFDRLYVVTVSPDGKASSALLRYGVPYKP